MSIHFIVQNPFSQLDQKPKKELPLLTNEHLTKAMLEDHEFLKPTPLSPPSSPSLPIFLTRNHRKMKALRKAEQIKICQKNGLISHTIPIMKTICYEVMTEDQLIVSRKQTQKHSARKRKADTQSLEKQIIREDIRVEQKTRQVLAMRLNQITEHKYHSNTSLLHSKIMSLHEDQKG